MDFATHLKELSKLSDLNLSSTFLGGTEFSNIVEKGLTLNKSIERVSDPPQFNIGMLIANKHTVISQAQSCVIVNCCRWLSKYCIVPVGQLNENCTDPNTADLTGRLTCQRIH